MAHILQKQTHTMEGGIQGAKRKGERYLGSYLMQVTQRQQDKGGRADKAEGGKIPTSDAGNTQAAGQGREG